jgi:hypothetical protein
MSPVASVLSLPNRETLTSDGPDRREQENTPGPSLRPIEDLLILIEDEELEALAKVFAMSPVRRAMTFEAYLAVRGFARRISKPSESRPKWEDTSSRPRQSFPVESAG